MATGDFSGTQGAGAEKDKLIPRIPLLTVFRLGVFQMGLGMMSVLTLGVLNRVMIEELKVPALIASGTLAAAQFVAPARVWFGQMSDAKPLFGYHRTGYVWIGAAVLSLNSFLAVQVVWGLGESLQATGPSGATTGWAVLLALVFALYGLALCCSSTPYSALLVDVSEEDSRSKLVGIVWSMLMVGIILGAIISSSLLKQISLNAPIEELRASINRLFLIVPAAVFGMALLAVAGVEKKYSHYATRSFLADREDKITLRRALRILTANPQAGLFFTFLLVMTLSLFLQDAILEPYGGEVFAMPISETTRLNAITGTGTLLGLSATGFLIVPRLGKQKTVKLGCIAAAICFVLLIFAGFTGNPALFKSALLIFGLASGILTTGALSLMLDLTAAETAGTFIGAWGLAQALARGVATVAGGAVLDIGRLLFDAPVLQYGLVFAMQVLGMSVAIWLLRRVNVKEFRDNAKAAIMAAIESNLD
ncbi:BCD family MFS transporter [Kamptonema formosum]|uniref:BCD family MFS transporter n=1 Tax=Kamptonema formosum TaxID=331992 RepID=UPI000378569E|nr:BCD family MFS transporter [Oscillatoria sp. PCC 10802]